MYYVSHNTRREVFILMEVFVLTVRTLSTPREKCPRCERLKGSKVFDFICPLCQYKFCSSCYKMIPEGDGSTIKCPWCERILNLPQKIIKKKTRALKRSLSTAKTSKD